MRWKKGDYVLCTKTHAPSPQELPTEYSAFIKGKIYLVKEVLGSTLLVVEDELGSTTNGWSNQFFVNLGSIKKLSKLEKLLYEIE